MVVIHDEVLLEKAEGLLGGRGSQADQECIEIFENLTPKIVDGAVALVGDYEIEGFNGDGGIVTDGFGKFGEIGPGLGGLFVLFVVELFTDQHGIEALDGGDAYFADEIDISAAEELRVVELGEFAAIIGGNELLKFVKGLAAERAAIDQEENAARASEFNEAVNEVTGCKRFAAACGHLDQGARAIFGEGFFEVEDGAGLCRPEAAVIKWRHDAELAANGTAGRFPVGLDPFRESLGLVEGEDGTAASVRFE